MFHRLTQHIELLLTEHTCVVVPAFGAFIVQHSSAKMQGDTLLAPHALVAFNAQLVHDDGLLISAYARVAKVKYPEAKRMVATDVKDLCEHLQQAPVALGRIGSFQLIEEKLIFTPAACAFLPDNFGMHNLTVQKRVAQPHSHAADTVTFTIRRNTLHRVAACMIGVCLLALAPKGMKNDYTTYANLSPVNFAQIVADREAAIEAERQAALAREEAARKEAERAKLHFHIVIAALDEDAAAKMCDNLLTQGYEDARVFPYKKNLHRVALASYKTKREALRAMKQTRQTTRYKHAWVWCE